MKIERGYIMNDFLEKNKVQYIIPVYQRNYEWEQDQCEKLYDDIIAASINSKPHFCGSFVYSRLCITNGIDRVVVIDGQQRLTTIYLLLKALIDCAKEDYEKEALQKSMINEDRWRDYSIDESSKLKLKPIKSDNIQLINLMKNNIENVDKTSGVWKNYQLFCELIQSSLDNGFTVKDIKLGLDELMVADISLDEEDSPQEIFERINSTGVPLSISDKIRNFILMTDEDQERLFDEYWSVIEELVDREDMDDFFLDYLNMKIDGLVSKADAYESFKSFFSNNEYTNEELLSELLHYSKFFNAFSKGNNSYCKEINTCLINLKLLKQTTLYPFLFRIFDDYTNSVIDEDELQKILKFILNYSVRRIVCEVGSNSLRGLYKSLYSRVFNRPENKENYYDAISSFLLQLNTKDEFPSNEVFYKSLKYNNIYKKNVLCKYLLALVENEGKEKIDINNLTIEHIMPQISNLSSNWKNMLGADWESVRNKYINTIGNLTLTGYNSELSDKDYLDKKNNYYITSTNKIKKLNEEIKIYDYWNEEVMEERSDRLSNIILDLFKIDLPTVKIDFSDPRYKDYSCVNVDLARNKTPKYFVLLGESINCTKFSDMLKIVIDRLYEYNPKIMLELARTNDDLGFSRTPLFSFDKELITNARQVKDSTIWHRTGFSASTIIYFIKLLLDKYDIDYDDFSYSARPTYEE